MSKQKKLPDLETPTFGSILTFVGGLTAVVGLMFLIAAIIFAFTDMGWQIVMSSFGISLSCIFGGASVGVLGEISKYQYYLCRVAQDQMKEEGA